MLSVPSKVLYRVLLGRIDDAVNQKLQEEQAGFRAGRGCIDQIFTLHTIIEQCTEWNTPVHINFIDFQKAFDSIHRDSLWKILASYGIPRKLISIITKFYNNYRACVAVNNNTTDFFKIATGVRQGCIPSPILFLIVIDWVIKNTVKDRKRGIQWGIRGQLEDLDFADDLAIMSHSHKQLQDNINRLIHFAKQVGLIIIVSKTEEMNIIEKPQIHININGENLKQVKKFTYLGSVIHSEEGAKADITNRINKARNTFMTLINIWQSKQYSLKTKIKLHNSNVKSVLLYGSECWRVVKNEMAVLNSFHNTCLRRIAKIFWPNKISNNDLYRKTGCQNIETEIQTKQLK